jgi:exopolysaccharide biosynthesis polyprenyl glycosylphosphotransferase
MPAASNPQAVRSLEETTRLEPRVRGLHSDSHDRSTRFPPRPDQPDANAHRDVLARERHYRLSLVLADMATAVAALYVAIVVICHDTLSPLFLVAAPLFVLVAKILGLYDQDELVIRKSTLAELPRLVNLAMLFTLFVWLGRSLIISGAPLGDRALVSVGLSLIVLICLFRTLARVFAARISSVERCLFVGDEGLFSRLQAKLSADRHVRLVGSLALADALGHDESRLAELSSIHRAHRLIIAPDESNQATLDLVRTAKAIGLRVSLLPNILTAVGSSVVFDDIDGMTLLGVPRFGLTRSSALVKRAFDLLGASMLLIASAPILLLVPILVKLDSRGPVFFRQVRVGRDGRHFSIFKFRTMVDGSDSQRAKLAGLNEADGLFKIADDPRVTRVGRWLRRSCMDELPQLFNVLRGEMSLVGPRPLVVDEDSRIKGLDRRRLHLTPGMTGHWQVLGSARVPLAEMVKIDYLYVANWSLWSDISILLSTIPTVLRRRGV